MKDFSQTDPLPNSALARKAPRFKQGYNIKPIIGVQLGVSAPLIFRAMATAIPKGYEPLPPGA
jgi:hypothetical protein